MVAPFLRLGKTFEQGKATAHEPQDVRHEDRTADKRSGPAKRHGKADAVVEERSVCSFDEAMVVLEAAEAAGDHAVLKEVRRIPGLGHDERDVIVGEAELQALPAHRVTRGDLADDAALHRMHAEFALDDSDACGESEAALNGCLDEDAVAERKHPGAFDAGRE